MLWIPLPELSGGATSPVGLSIPHQRWPGGIVYVGSRDHSLYALDASTGELRWSARAADVIDSTPTIDNGVVYVGSHDHRLYALSAQTGEKLWSYTTGGRINSSPSVANGIVYVGSNDHNLYAFNQTVISAEAER